MDNALKLQTLRWSVDSLVFLCEYECFCWLKPCFNILKVRIGITKCCEYDNECSHHLNVREKSENQNSKLN